MQQRFLAIAKIALLASAIAAAVTGTAAAQQRGGAITASVTVEPRSLDPLGGDAASVDQQLLIALYDSLTRWAPDGTVVPHLAKSWAFSNNGMTLTLELAQGVTFHDGTPFNAEAVVFNLMRLVTGNVVSIYKSDMADVASAEAVGSFTVKISMKTPSASLLASFAGPVGYMASPTAVRALGQDYAYKPVGTGPFKLASRQAGTNVVVARNPNYWRNGKDGKPLPYLDGVTFRFITQTAVKMIELESGNIQLTDDLQPEDHNRVDASQKLKLIDAGGISHWMVFNITKKPFDDKRVRQALYYALDRPTIARIVAGKYGIVPPTLIQPGEFTYDGTIDPYKYDPQKARALLAEAGFTPARPLTLGVSIIQREPDTSIVQIAVAQLAEVGVKATIKVLERQAFVDEWRAVRHEVGFARVDTPRGDPDAMFSLFFGRGAPQRSGRGNEELYNMIDAGRLTLDTPTRKKIYVDIQKKLLDEAAYIWLFMRESKHARSADLQNLFVSPIKGWFLDEAWLTR